MKDTDCISAYFGRRSFKNIYLHLMFSSVLNRDTKASFARMTPFVLTFFSNLNMTVGSINLSIHGSTCQYTVQLVNTRFKTNFLLVKNTLPRKKKTEVQLFKSLTLQMIPFSCERKKTSPTFQTLKRFLKKFFLVRRTPSGKKNFKYSRTKNSSFFVYKTSFQKKQGSNFQSPETSKCVSVVGMKKNQSRNNNN